MARSDPAWKRRKCVYLHEDIHALLKAEAKKQGMMIQALTDQIIAEYFETQLIFAEVKHEVKAAEEQWIKEFMSELAEEHTEKKDF